jgi:hypothetical protein
MRPGPCPSSAAPLASRVHVGTLDEWLNPVDMQWRLRIRKKRSMGCPRVLKLMLDTLLYFEGKRVHLSSHGQSQLNDFKGQSG